MAKILSGDIQYWSKTPLNEIDGIQYYVTDSGTFCCKFKEEWYQASTLAVLRKKLSKLTSPIKVMILEGYSWQPNAPIVEKVVGFEKDRIRTDKKLHAYSANVYLYDEEFIAKTQEIRNKYDALMREWNQLLKETPRFTGETLESMRKESENHIEIPE